MGLGALISGGLKLALKKRTEAAKLQDKTGLVASGLLGGEGITGVAIAFISMLK
jgi:uncharacterized oligopeptide transporter (OPT) family protein